MQNCFSIKYAAIIVVSFINTHFVVAQSDISPKSLNHLSGASVETPRGRSLDRWSFTGTQEWNPKYLGLTRKKTKYLPNDWQEMIIIPKPPKNSSVRTKEELNYLTDLISKRPLAIKEIEAEVSQKNLRWGKYTFQDLTTIKRYPLTSKLIKLTYDELAVVCFVYKQKFNRVRPFILAKKMGMNLSTAVKVPDHPAYPSGHSIEAYTLAYIIQELDPENAEQYRNDATRIAHNREIGGLHYPSDSEAGRQVARQIADLLLENELYKSLLESAREEWK